MESEEKIQAHVLSVWKESRGLFGGKGKEGMLILTSKRLLFIKKTEAGIKWWGAVRTRQTVRLLQSKDVMVVEDGYGEEKLRADLENKKNQKINFDNILYIEAKEKVWGTVLGASSGNSSIRKVTSFMLMRTALNFISSISS